MVFAKSIISGWLQIDGLANDLSNSIANTLDLL